MLNFSLVEPPSPPSRWALMLHGILGSGNNLRGLARALVKARPSWGVVLADLRLHGDSRWEPPPHTLDAAADDLLALRDAVPGPVRAVIGHSFGGKVALRFVERHGEGLEQAWILDAMPGPRPGARGSEDTLRVIDALRRAGPVFASRQAFVDRMMELGQGESIARWLAMNLERDGEAFRVALDLGAIEKMLLDYFDRDLWHVVERPRSGLSMHLVIGGQSRVFDAAERARAELIAERSGELRASPRGRVHVHVLPRAGHWVHADDPDGLLALLMASM